MVKKDNKAAWENQQTDGESIEIDDNDADGDEEQWEDDEEEVNVDGGENEAADSDSDSSSSDKASDKSEDKVVWTGQGKRIPVIIFHAQAITGKDPKSKDIGDRYHMSFKAGKTECKVVRQILVSHGFHEVHPNSSDFNLMWTGSHIKPFILRSLQDFQKVNHFPRSYEITRKDRLYKNIQKMQQTKGFRHFDFVPLSFILPSEFQDFCNAFVKDKGPWIMKPVASSRGRGISLITSPDQVCLEEPMVICKYLGNPLLIDGFKFDLRMYVLVSSFDPLIIYLYEEGLTRFATVQYDKASKHVRNNFMHLTNYSVNKKNDDYVMNDDPDVEDYGNKWSMGALLRYLKSLGKDTTSLMMRVEDVIIKTIISAELPIAVACKMFVPWKGNCFELFGFDILIDENLKPWVLEVNLSPSLACESPLDLKIKANMLSDMFSLVGFVCHDPMSKTAHSNQRLMEMMRPGPGVRVLSAHVGRKSVGSATRKGATSAAATRQPAVSSSLTLSAEEVKIVRRTKEEYSRRGGWVRIFPSPDSWELYGSFLQYSSSHNFMLYQQLFPDRAKLLTSKPTSGPSKSRMSSTNAAGSSTTDKMSEEILACCLQHLSQYERKLCSLGKKPRNSERTKSNSQSLNKNFSSYESEKARGNVQEADKYGKKVNDRTSNAQADDAIDASKINNDSKAKAAIESKLYKSNSLESVERRPNSVDRREKHVFVERGGSLKHDDRKQDNGNAMDIKKGVITTVSESGKDSNSKVTKKSDATVPVVKESSSITSSSSRRTAASSTEDVSDQQKLMMKSAPKVVVKQESSEEKIKLKLKTSDIISLLDSGKIISKVQARTAFATYLSRVHQRLLNETNADEGDDSDSSNEQMDLVLRFLKRAAGNLQQPMKVIIPSHKLPLNDRRRILAKELGDFVHIYNRETEQLQQRLLLEERCRSTVLPPQSSSNLIDKDMWQRFVHTASESELEEVLTIYTKINKSASVFLGSAISGGTTANSAVIYDGGASGDNVAALPKRKDHKVSAGGQGLMPKGSTEYVLTSEQLATERTTALHDVALAYGTATYQPTLKRRPHSAAVERGQGNTQTIRPQSASVENSYASFFSSMRRERPDGAECPPYEYTKKANEDVGAALQRLANKQRARQYSANKKLTILGNVKESEQSTAEHAWNTNYMSTANQTKEYLSFSNSGLANQRTLSQNGHWPASSSASALNSYGSHSRHNKVVASDSSDDEAMHAYTLVTGVEPKNRSYVPTEGSTQYQLLQQQQSQVRRSSQGSVKLGEDSKVIHQAMVAKAHQAYRQQKGPATVEQDHNSAMHVPKPPIAPRSSKKPVGFRHKVVSAEGEQEPITAVGEMHLKNLQSGGLYIKEV